MLVTAAGRALSIGLAFLTTLWVIRYLGPDRYGVYLVVLSILALVDITLDASLFTIAVREIAKAKERSCEWLRAVTVVSGSMGVFFSLLFLVAPWFVELGEDAAGAVRMGSVVFLISTFRTPVIYFRAFLMVQWELGFRVLAYAIELGLILLLTHMGRGIGALMAAKALATASFVLFLWIAILARFRVGLRGELGLIRPLVVLSFPLGLTALLVLLQVKGDILLIGWILGPKEAGAYGAVAQVAELGSVISNVLVVTSVPFLAQSLAKGDGQQFQSYFQRLFDGLITFAPGIGFICCLLADPLVRVGFGVNYAAVVPEFRLLVWVAVLIPVADLMGSTAVTLNLQNRLVKIELVSVIITLTANVILLGLMGTLAAAWIRLGVYAIGMIWAYGIIRAESEYHLTFKRLISAAVAAGVAGTLIGVTPWPHPVVIALLGALAYVTALYALGTLRTAGSGRHPERSWERQRPEAVPRHLQKGSVP